MHRIDVAISPNVIYPKESSGRTLRILSSYPLSRSNSYYILLDSGMYIYTV